MQYSGESWKTKLWQTAYRINFNDILAQLARSMVADRLSDWQTWNAPSEMENDGLTLLLEEEVA
jgi:hypothetical protein